MNSFLSQHWAAIGGAVVYVTLAAVATMPPKGTKWSGSVLYDWIYDCSHLMVNQRGQKGSLPLDRPVEK